MLIELADELDMEGVEGGSEKEENEEQPSLIWHWVHGDQQERPWTNRWDSECGNQDFCIDFCIDCIKFEIPVIPEREIKTCKITTKQMRGFLIFPYSLLFKPILDFISNRENS